MKKLYDIEEISKLIESGEKLLLAGDRKLLTKLPKGNWVAGTIPYFVAVSGGMFNNKQIYADVLPDYIENIEIKVYDIESIKNIHKDAPEHGFSVIIIPSNSKMHSEFSLQSVNYEKFGYKPLIGWLSGIELNNSNNEKPAVISGNDCIIREEGAIVMHVVLPKDKYADVGIINIFEQGNGEILTFAEDGFSVKDVIINGKKQNFADYINSAKYDLKLPLVADYHGAMINTSYRAIDEKNKLIHFYAPVFKGIEYKQAKPIENYSEDFLRQLLELEKTSRIIFSFNCILNYLYGNLEGKKFGNVFFPCTFGEIAYQLLNQTLVYLKIEDL